MTDRTENIPESVAERVSRTEWPFCETDDWVGPRLVALPTTEIGVYQLGRGGDDDLGRGHTGTAASSKPTASLSELFRVTTRRGWSTAYCSGATGRYAVNVNPFSRMRRIAV